MLVYYIIYVIISMHDDLLWPALGRASNVIIFSGPKPPTYWKHKIVSRDRTQHEPISEVHQGGRRMARLFGKWAKSCGSCQGAIWCERSRPVTEEKTERWGAKGRR